MLAERELVDYINSSISLILGFTGPEKMKDNSYLGWIWNQNVKNQDEYFKIVYGKLIISPVYCLIEKIMELWIH